MHCPVHDQGGRGFQPRPGRRHSSRANGHEIYGDEQTNALPAEHCATGLETPDRSLLQVLRLNGNFLVKAMRQCRIFWLNTMSRSIFDNLLTFSVAQIRTTNTWKSPDCRVQLAGPWRAFASSNRVSRPKLRPQNRH